MKIFIVHLQRTATMTTAKRATSTSSATMTTAPSANANATS